MVHTSMAGRTSDSAAAGHLVIVVQFALGRFGLLQWFGLACTTSAHLFKLVYGLDCREYTGPDTGRALAAWAATY